MTLLLLMSNIRIRKLLQINLVVRASEVMINNHASLANNDDMDEYDDTIDIHAETFSNDYDDVAWNPITVDDSDEEEEEKYGLN